jgi:hypothetical protein
MRIFSSGTLKGSSSGKSTSNSRWWKSPKSIGHSSNGYRVFSKPGKQTSDSKDGGGSQVALSRSDDFEEGIMVTRDIELRSSGGRIPGASPF